MKTACKNSRCLPLTAPFLNLVFDPPSCSRKGTGSVWILTPKALANFSPAVRAQREPWDSNKTIPRNPESGFICFFCHETQGSANPGLTLANAFGVKSKLNQYARKYSLHDQKTRVWRFLQDTPDYTEALFKLSSTSWCSNAHAHRVRRFLSAGHECLSRCDKHTAPSQLCGEFVAAPWLWQM